MTEPKKRGRPAKKTIADQKPEETQPVVESSGACPAGDNARGNKTPAVIRWNAKHRPDEMETIYRGWDWQGYLASNPPE